MKLLRECTTLPPPLPFAPSFLIGGQNDVANHPPTPAEEATNDKVPLIKKKMKPKATINKKIRGGNNLRQLVREAEQKLNCCDKRAELNEILNKLDENDIPFDFRNFFSDQNQDEIRPKTRDILDRKRHKKRNTIKNAHFIFKKKLNFYIN